MKNGLQAAIVFAKLGAIVTKLGFDVLGAVPGGITPDEAEKLARKALEDEDIKLKVKGEDIIDDKAQADLASGLARIASRLGSALTPDDV